MAHLGLESSLLTISGTGLSHDIYHIWDRAQRGFHGEGARVGGTVMVPVQVRATGGGLQGEGYRARAWPYLLRKEAILLQMITLETVG